MDLAPNETIPVLLSEMPGAANARRRQIAGANLGEVQRADGSRIASVVLAIPLLTIFGQAVEFARLALAIDI